MNKTMTLSPELTEALCDFCGDVATMENNVDLISCIEDHFIDNDTDEPAQVLDTLKSLRTMKRDMLNILKAMRKAEKI
ncbi:MAG: hypothetical protein Q4E48_01735 [Prevotella sp.]|nr:hypothetical protein [Prevotella sp.]